jgi:hypothetical protein
MEATCSSETLLHFQRITWRYISQDTTLQICGIVRHIITDFEIKIPVAYRPSFLFGYIDVIYCHDFRETADGVWIDNGIY